MKILQNIRSGTTLIELLIFLGILGIVIGTILPTLMLSNENRSLQQTASIVEQNGAQLIEHIGRHIRQAERIVVPAIGSTGSVLVLQTESGTTNPTILGIGSGTLVVIQRANKLDLSTPQVAVSNLVFRNTSTSVTRQSVLVTFRITRTIRLQSPHTYQRDYRIVYSLYPDDVTATSVCTCATPYCLAGGDNFLWNICNPDCDLVTTQLDCP